MRWIHGNDKPQPICAAADFLRGRIFAMPTPYCLALVMCDAVHQDPATRKFTILGTFANFSARAYPTDAQMTVYFAITDGIGPVTVSLQMVDSRGGFIDANHPDPDDNRILHISNQIEIESPLAVVEGVFGVRFTLPRPGVYHCELWADQEMLMSRRLTASVIPSTKTKDIRDEPQ